MSIPNYDLRPDLAFLFPDGMDPLAVPILAAGQPLPHGTEAAIVRGRSSLRGGGMEGLPEHHGLWAVPRGTGMPRALVPDTDRAAARTLLAPRVIDSAPIARILRFGVQRLPVHLLLSLGQPVLVAAREESDIVRAFRAILPTAAIGCYLGNSVNQGRSSAQAFINGNARAIAKIVHELEGRSRVADEAELLGTLATVPSVRSIVPKLLGQFRTSFGEVLITDAFPGTPGTPDVRAPVDEFLAKCDLGRPRPAGESELLQRASGFGIAAGYSELVDRASSAIKADIVPTVITHGDFVPWNVRLHEGTLMAFDWEYGCLDGLPEWDSMYFRVQVGIVHKHWGVAALDSAVRDRLSHPAPPWTSIGQRALAAFVLLDLAARYQRRSDARREHLALNVARGLMA